MIVIILRDVRAQWSVSFSNKKELNFKTEWISKFKKNWILSNKIENCWIWKKKREKRKRKEKKTEEENKRKSFLKTKRKKKNEKKIVLLILKRVLEKRISHGLFLQKSKWNLAKDSNQSVELLKSMFYNFYFGLT